MFPCGGGFALLGNSKEDEIKPTRANEKIKQSKTEGRQVTFTKTLDNKGFGTKSLKNF